MPTRCYTDGLVYHVTLFKIVSAASCFCLFGQLSIIQDVCSGPFINATSIAALSPAPSVMGVAPSLMEKPSHMDYSDLASILMDNATKTEVRVSPCHLSPVLQQYSWS